MSDAEEVERLRKELDRAYRALRGFYGCVVNGKEPDRAMHGYHGPTLGAAMRYVDENSLEGSEYFIGKPVTVLHETLAKYHRT